MTQPAGLNIQAAELELHKKIGCSIKFDEINTDIGTWNVLADPSCSIGIAEFVCLHTN